MYLPSLSYGYFNGVYLASLILWLFCWCVSSFADPMVVLLQMSADREGQSGSSSSSSGESSETKEDQEKKEEKN